MNIPVRLSIIIDTLFFIILLIAIPIFLLWCGWTIFSHATISAVSSAPQSKRLYAQVISTNLVHVPCPCGFCRPSEGIAVPEHINQLGFDTKLVVSTSYYPIVILPRDL